MLDKRFKKYSLIAITASALMMSGCSDEETQGAKEELKKTQVAQKAQEVQKSVEASVKESKEEVKEVLEETKEETQELVQKAKEEVKELSKEVDAKPVEKVDEVVPQASKSAEEIYKTCLPCHGVKAEKVAMGKSKVIQGWEAAKIVEALKGYKDGSYGGAMKAVMKTQVLRLSEEEMQTVAEYISKL